MIIMIVVLAVAVAVVVVLLLVLVLVLVLVVLVTTLVMEQLKHRATAKATKVKRYDNRIKQFQDNRNFETNQGRFFKNLEGKEERTKPPNAEDATEFWKGIWGTKVEHKRDAEWIDKAKEKMPSEKQNTVKITKDDVKGKLKVSARLERSRT